MPRISVAGNVTRLGDLLDFGQVLNVSKSIIFLVKSFLVNFYRNLAIFLRAHWLQATQSMLRLTINGHEPYTIQEPMS